MIFVTVCVYGSFSHLKGAIAKDRGEDGSGQHGEDGQQDRHASCDDKIVIAVQWF